MVNKPIDDREAQRRSFAYGNAKLDNDDVTREMVDQAAEEMENEPKVFTEAKDNQ